MSQENVEIVRGAYEAFNQRDLVLALSPFDSNFEWIPSERDLAGPVSGRDEVERFIEEQLEAFDEFEMQPEEIVGKEDQVLALVHLKGSGSVSGAEFDIRIAHIWTVQDGRLVRCEVYAERDDALEAVGLEG